MDDVKWLIAFLCVVAISLACFGVGYSKYSADIEIQCIKLGGEMQGRNADLACKMPAKKDFP